jgi:hypothetical protein
MKKLLLAAMIAVVGLAPAFAAGGGAGGGGGAALEAVRVRQVAAVPRPVEEPLVAAAVLPQAMAE